MKIIKGDLILKKNTVFNESINVEGDIEGDFDLTVRGDINAEHIKACNIKAWDIKADDIYALNIKAWDIDAGDINAKNIKAWDIKAEDINAKNIKALDIYAFNIKAWDINYYAVCFAHNNITCKSIKGRRENSKHFCLDGKIKKVRE